MKSAPARVTDQVSLVTPLAGVWIEIMLRIILTLQRTSVTPLAGVWIEIEEFDLGIKK